MLVAIIKNIDRTYEYLYEIQGKLISFHIDKDGFSLSNDPYINTIISKFKYNSSCEYLTDFKNYKVYYDSLTGFNHFISNGVENYEMFFKFNGIDARCYKDGQKRNIYSKLFAILGVSVILTYAGFTSLVGLKYDTNIYYATHTSHNITELTEMYKNEKLDYKDAINSINSSNLPDGVKAVISDESFLKLIFSYYENSPLEYTSSLKFNDLKLGRFKEDNRQDENTKGYYDSFTPNVLYSKEGQSKDEEIPTLIHEFIHLLQAEGNSYYYLNEAVAELMTSELLESSPVTYFDAIENLKLLINIIGPEPIYELSFGGDDTSLNNILKSNLTNKEVITLKYYLQKDAVDINNNSDIHIEIKKILYKLYKNMYGKDIEEDQNIMCILNDNLSLSASIKDERYFLVPNKMEDEEYIKVVGEDKKLLAQKGFLSEKTCYKEFSKIDSNYYNKNKESNDIELIENLNENGEIIGKIMTDGYKTYYKLLLSPIPTSQYEFFSFRTLPSQTISISDAINKGYIDAYKVSYSLENKGSNSYEYVYFVPNSKEVKLEENVCTFKVCGVKSRFKEQYNSLMQKMIDKDYHK